ncbi:hypothetical protein ABB08_15540 [Paenibacillus larvae]|nr:hypothetical protein [Paenibacillus larvae]
MLYAGPSVKALFRVPETARSRIEAKKPLRLRQKKQTKVFKRLSSAKYFINNTKAVLFIRDSLILIPLQA